MPRCFYGLLVAVCLCGPVSRAKVLSAAQGGGASGNTHPVYKELRAAAVGSVAYQVSNFVLQKDAAAFTLTGTLHMLPPVQGRITGAVFVGQGSMAYTPPVAAERGMLRALTKGEDFNETFERAVFRFTDNTADEIKAAAAGPGTGAASQAQDVLKDTNQALRFRLRDNLHARILHDILSPAPGRLFHAYVTGKKYSNRFAYMIDPQGVGFVAPEEVALVSWADFNDGIFAAHHYIDAYKSRQRPQVLPGTWIDITHQKLQTAVEPSGELAGDATTTFVSLVDGLSAVPFSLFPSLRVSSVTDAAGVPLAYIQESKDEDADFWVVLPQPLKKGERFSVRTLYKGKDAVLSEGNDNYYPVARSNWYPNNTGTKDYAQYEMTFSVAKRLKLVATGDFVSETTEGDRNVSRWKTDYPLSVAGFNLGLFKRDEGKAGEYMVVALANTLPSNSTTELLRAAEALNMPMGSLTTASANRVALSEAQIAMQVFSDYFGPLPFKRVHMTQQTACNYGQAWPGVIYIPTCYYWPATVRQQLGLLAGSRGYWDTVAAHEVAHLWWGHAVGWNSYRDQWMSEGFSNLAASIFLQVAYQKEPQKYREFWKGMLTDLTERNRQGFRAIDVGPVTLGHRLSTGRTGDIGSSLIYPKGAFILHMIRMMMWTREDADARFKTMLRDFVATHKNQPVSTEDFKAIVEKHMVGDMNLGNDGTMNWFFNQYVYGTDLPTYKLEQSIANQGGQNVLSLKITQSGVSDAFRMLVPIYLELQDGRIIRLGSAHITGNKTVEQNVPLGQIPVKRAILNYYYDVLAVEQN